MKTKIQNTVGWAMIVAPFITLFVYGLVTDLSGIVDFLTCMAILAAGIGYVWVVLYLITRR